MENHEEKAAIIGIFIKDFNAISKVNGILHDFAGDIIGRIGIPCREKDLHRVRRLRISVLSGPVVQVP